MRLLVIKMSSLGDVVHALAAVTDAARALPGLEVDWVVEEAYRDLPFWNAAVRTVITSPLRRLRRSPGQWVSLGEWNTFRRELRRERYDLVLDAQGLFKSAAVGLAARGPLAGRDVRSAREGAAALFYGKRLAIDLARPEVEQLRQLFALALEYPAPNRPADFGVDPGKLPPTQPRRPYVVFVHGAAWPAKLWPESHWAELGEWVAARGLEILLPWGNEPERLRAENLARRWGGIVLPSLSIPALAAVLAQSRCVVGLDTGLTHIAVALGRPVVALYGPSVPVYHQVAGGALVSLGSHPAQRVDTSRPNRVPVEQATRALEQLLPLQPA